MSYEYQYVKFSSTRDINLPDGSEVSEFILCTQQADLGYGSADRAILNKGLSVGDIRYSVGADGLQQVQNTTISFSNVGQFYELMREINSDNFWATLKVEIYWASGRVPTLAYYGYYWFADGETEVTFTPSNAYPLTTDYIKKEFEGVISAPTINSDTISLSLVSKSKQDSYLVGSIQSFNGADSSRSKISPILLGDMTDEYAYIPLILKNAITSKSTAICSDIPLFDAPTAYIYDDENEKFHQVINDQKATNENKQLEFYNEDNSENFTLDGDFIETNKDANDLPKYYTLPSGEVVGYFTDYDDYIIFNDHSLASDYNLTNTTNRLRNEGCRDVNSDGIYSDGTLSGFKIDADMAVGIAKLKLLLYPNNIKIADPLGNILQTPNEVGYYSLLNRPSAYNDFYDEGIVINSYPSAIGSFKNFTNYKDTAPRADRLEPSFNDSTDSIWLSPLCNYKGDTISEDWRYYNYTNKVAIGVTFDFDKFKYNADVITCKTYVYGAVYKDWYYSSDSTALEFTGVSGTAISSRVTIGDSSVSGTFLHNDSTLSTNIFTINDYWLAENYSNLSDFYDNPPTITFQGFSAYNPVKSTTPTAEPPNPSDCFLDIADPSFYGSSRFALDGVRSDIVVNASVESKYWCFKGRTGDDVFLLDGLNTLSTRYNNTSFTLRDSSRSTWKLAGAHTGEPIYYRDLLSNIANEFRVFITDKNGSSDIVSMGLDSAPVYTIDESNVPSPWNSNVTFSETDSSDIYNKIVIRYAKNHMTDKYGKTISISSSLVQKTSGVPSFDNEAELQSYLSEADETLSFIGITEKVKTIDLDWVRDDLTANNILEWWCKNSYKQRALLSVKVSKLKLIDVQIGDVVDVSLPSLPNFYKKNYQVTKIVNSKDHKYSLELEEFEGVEGAVQGIEIGGRIYSTVVIGDLEWMSENLKDESVDFVYPDNNPLNKETYGLLYFYNDAVSLVPDGWRLPTKADFENLVSLTGTSSLAGKNLKINDASIWSNSTYRGLDDYGFSAVSSGEVKGGGIYPIIIIDNIGVNAQFHTSTFELTGWTAIFRIENSSPYHVFETEWTTLNNSNRPNFSVRYVRNI